MKELPSADDFFNPQSSQPDKAALPTADEFFAPSQPSGLELAKNAASSIVTSKGISSPAVDEFMKKTPAGRIMGAFGAGFTEGGQGGALGIEPGGDVESALTKAGIFNDYAKGQNDILKGANEAFIRPAAVVLDNEFRGAKAAMGAIGGGLLQTAHEIGTAIEGNNTTPLLEQFAEYALTTPAFMGAHEVPPQITAARSVGAIGESEASYFGLTEPTPEQSIAREQAASHNMPSLNEADLTEQSPIKEQPSTPVIEKNVHDIAREVSPEIFNEYDTLNTQRNTIGKWMSDLSDNRRQDAEANAPHNEEIAELQDKLENANVRKSKIYQAKIDDLIEQNNQYIEEQIAKDTPDIKLVREQLQKIDYRMRDLAPDVSAAYREADSRIPKKNNQELLEVEQNKQSEENANISEQPPSVENTDISNQGAPPQQVKPIEQQLQSINDDVSRKLVAIGRSQEEAEASAQLIAEHYKSIAEQGWTKGTPEEIYKRDTANIIAGKEKVRNGAREFAQKAKGKIRLATDDAKAAITLFKTADASTFIHETGHAWLDEMMRYAKAEGAPEGLLKDRDTVNKWLGSKEGEEITRAQHEKFARGFERYLMEGTAPSKELANVFAKFKKWLTDIYQAVQRLKSPITDDIRHVFDRLLAANPERTVIAPEREIPEIPQELTEKDLQNDRNQRNLIDKTQTSTGSSGQPERAAEAQGISAEPTQRHGGGSQSTERDSGEQQSNIPNNPNARLEKAESKFVDKAGNIRLDNLNTPEDINAVIRETASQNDNFMGARRGVISDGQVLDLADALGMNPEELSKRKLGQAYNAEQIIAARKLLIQSAETVRDLGAKAAEGAESDLMAYAEARARHITIQEQVSGITAEAGRALRAFQQLEGGAEAKAVGEFLKENTGLDLFQLQQEAKQLSLLDTTQKVSKLINDANKPTYKNMILEYYINALISGPITHLRYSVGNALNALWTPLVEVPTAAGIGRIREVITGKINPNRIYLGEAGAQLHGIIQGSKNGLMAASEAWKTAVSPALPGEEVSPMFATKTNAIPGFWGKVINIPSKGVAAIHSFFKSIRYEQNIQGLAYREAMKEGLEEGTEAFTNRIADLGSNPTESMMESAVSDALKELYMTPTEYNSAAGALNRFTNSNLAAKIIMPFMKIGSQITRNAFIERTPLGLLTSDVREKAFYAEGVPAGDMQLAKMSAGVALMGGVSALVLEGMATGDGPNDPAQRAIWLMNHSANSIQIGDITIKYQGLGSLGMLMRFSANMTETAQGWDEEDGTKLAKSFMEGITKSVLDENFMRGLKDMLDAIYHPQEYGANYVRQFATNWLPFSVGAGQIARMIDPSQREAHDIFEAAQNKVLFASKDLMPKRDRFGEIIPNGTNTRYTNDPVIQRMESLHMGVGKLGKKIRGVELTEQQYDDYARLAGRMTKMRLNNYVSIPQTASLPSEIQIKTIHSIIESSREGARNIVMMNNIGIVKQAYQNKVNALKKP